MACSIKFNFDQFTCNYFNFKGAFTKYRFHNLFIHLSTFLAGVSVLSFLRFTYEHPPDPLPGAAFTGQLKQRWKVTCSLWTLRCLPRHRLRRPSPTASSKLGSTVIAVSACRPPLKDWSPLVCLSTYVRSLSPAL